MRTIDEIYESMAHDYAARCGLVLREGGDMSLRFYAAAAQVFALEAQMEFSLRQAFPQTASGEYLDRHAGVRGLARGGGSRAAGTIRFFLGEAAPDDITVAAGTVCRDDGGQEFLTTESAVIAAGQLWCEAPAEARLTGSAGNVPAGTVTHMVLAPAGVSGCQNPAAFAGGSDGEDDDSLRRRVLGSYSSLPNGANAAYYETQALAVDGVYAVSVLPKRRGTGTVDVFVAAADGPAPQSVVEQVRARLEAQREICVDIAVAAPEARTVDVTMALAAADFAAARGRAETAVRALFDGALIGRGVTLAMLISAAFGAGGVENCRISAPAADIAPAEGVLPVLGNLTIEEMAV